MSERKVLTKYYPPDFDPSKLKRERKPANAGPKVMTIRLMAPFSMKCTSCGEYIYKGRKFNARKETAEEKYLNIAIYRFYIRCTRCSSEITFKTDPKNMDYVCEKGAKRNFEPWRSGHVEETDEERLNRLEIERAEEEGGEGSGVVRDVMEELEGKTNDARTEMQIADALDEIRSRNARNEMTAKASGGDIVTVENSVDEDAARQEREDEEAARAAFRNAAAASAVTEEPETTMVVAEEPAEQLMPPPSIPFKRAVKKRKDFGAALGIKKKAALV